MNRPHFVFLSSVHTHLDCLCFLDSLNDIAVSIHVQVFVWAYIFRSLRYIPGSGTELSYHLVTIFGLLRNGQIFLATLWHAGSGIKPVPPAIETQSLNHWTAGEVPARLFLINHVHSQQQHVGILVCPYPYHTCLFGYNYCSGH